MISGRRVRRYLALLLALGLATPASAAGPPPADDAHDLVVLHPARPYRLRARLRLDGQSYQAPWARQVAALFRHLDADGDGRLSAKELRAAPGPAQWRQMALGVGHIDPEAAPALGKSVTLAELRAYYGPSGAGPLRVAGAWRYRSGPDSVSTRLFARLDRNRDGKLSKAELLAAPRLLTELDGDEDEMVSAGELLGFRGYYEQTIVTTAGQPHGVVSGGLPFFSLRPGAAAAPLVKALLGRYDANRDNALSLKESGLGAAFAQLDTNRDGRLGAAELAAWVGLPADLELDVDLGRAGAVTARPGGLAAKATAVGLAVRIGDWTLELRGLGTAARSPAPPAAAADLFAELDANGDGYFTDAEASQPPFRHVALLRLADRDGDGKVSRKEYEAFARFQRQVRGVVTSVVVADQGRSLFGWLDSDGDQSLGLRELRTAWARLAGASGGKESFTDKEVPQGYVISFWHGALGGEDAQAAILERRVRPAPRGPVWFRKMDRNGDGDVSRAEWLGEPGMFAKIDADGDGLVSVEEADKADRLYRNKR